MELMRGSALAAAVEFQDPPIIAQGGGIPSIDEWPGRRMDESDVIKAAQNGYGRDWFRFYHRWGIFEPIWGRRGPIRPGKRGKERPLLL